ncbi:MAG: nicotinate (nicotinamide) nucleotide adenylyltransferase [Solirubrobacterales bacterium]|nr:nicotinate (nicotinamide) nucleotide adenylyltransferase [Solirubrobacterales bacterium]
MRIGILGGTFNPPHLGHLICAQEAYVQLGLDRVTLIPARIPPHKAIEDEPGAEHRLELCRLSIRGDEERFDVSDVEIVRDGPSYTVDTLEELHSQAPDHELFLIVGGDIAAGLPDWRAPEQVLSLATLAVAKRRGTSRAAVDDALHRLRGGERARFFRMPRIGISSTMLRDRVRAGQPIKYYVPDAAVSYIARHRLYARIGSVR